MNDEMNQAGRLAMRREGPMWVAYYAKEGTMVGATVLGSIGIPLVHNSQTLREEFMGLMREALGEFLGSEGIEVEWADPEPGLDERAGHS